MDKILHNNCPDFTAPPAQPGQRSGQVPQAAPAPPAAKSKEEKQHDLRNEALQYCANQANSELMAQS